MSTTTTASRTHTHATPPLRPTVPWFGDEEADALCRIVAKVLATRAPLPQAWVLWSPTSPLTASLAILLRPHEVTAAWHLLLARGWMQQHYMRGGLHFRLTPLGQHGILAPLPALPRAPDWYRAVLDHLYPQTPRPLHLP